MRPKGPFKFGKLSRAVRATLHPKLIELLDYAIQRVDFSQLRGIRDVAQQEWNVARNLSKTMNSRHLPGGGHPDFMDYEPDYPDRSYAVDLAPFVNGAVSFEEREVSFLQGYLLCAADELGIIIRQGLDWDSDFNQREHPFWDAVHVELPRGIYQ